MKHRLILHTRPLHFSLFSLIPKFPTTLPIYLLPRHPPRQRPDRARRHALRRSNQTSKLEAFMFPQV